MNIWLRIYKTGAWKWFGQQTTHVKVLVNLEFGEPS
jgi:hypothetical protein